MYDCSQKVGNLESRQIQRWREIGNNVFDARQSEDRAQYSPE